MSDITMLNLEQMPLEELKRLAIEEAKKEEEAQQAALAAQNEEPKVEKSKEEQPRDEQGRFVKTDDSASDGDKESEGDTSSASSAAKTPKAPTSPKQPKVESDEASDEDDDENVYVASRTLEIEEGAGSEVFTAEGRTKEEALENLLDKIAEAKKHASKKIRQQEAENKLLRDKVREKETLKPVSEDLEYIRAQEIQKTPTETVRKILQEDLGDIQEIKEAVGLYRKQLQQQQANDEIGVFLTLHEDYEDAGATGVKNGAIMRMKLAELGLPTTAENLHKAYVSLRKGGLLYLKGNEANANTEQTPKEERIAQTTEEVNVVPKETPKAEPKATETPKVEVPQARTKKASGISSQSTNRAMPNTEPSEDEAYNLPIEKLKELANKQLASRQQ